MVLFVGIPFTVNIDIRLCSKGHSKSRVGEWVAMMDAPADASEVAERRNAGQSCRGEILLPQLHHALVTHIT